VRASLSKRQRCQTAVCEISRRVTTERVARQVSCLASHWGVHLRLLLFTLSLSNAFGFSALSPYSFTMSLSPPTVALSLSRVRFRLNGGFGARVRRMHSASRLPLLSLLIVSPSLYTLWRLCRKLSKEAIMLLFPFLFFIFVGLIRLF
jgi:hypothetical protein